MLSALTGTCIVCIAHALVLEGLKIQSADPWTTMQVITGIQALAIIPWLCIQRKQMPWTIAKGLPLREGLLVGGFYVSSIILSAASQWLGINGLTILVIRSSAPVITAFLITIHTRKLPSRHHATSFLLMFTAVLMTSLASLQRDTITETSTDIYWVAIGLVVAVYSTIMSCALTIIQSMDHMREHPYSMQMWMHGLFLVSFGLNFFAGSSPLPWIKSLWATTQGCLFLVIVPSAQLLCSQSIVYITQKYGAARCQMTLAARRVLTALLIAWLYRHALNLGHILGLLIMICAWIIFSHRSKQA